MNKNRWSSTTVFAVLVALAAAATNVADSEDTGWLPQPSLLEEEGTGHDAELTVENVTSDSIWTSYKVDAGVIIQQSGLIWEQGADDSGNVDCLDHASGGGFAEVDGDKVVHHCNLFNLSSCLEYHLKLIVAPRYASTADDYYYGTATQATGFDDEANPSLDVTCTITNRTILVEWLDVLTECNASSYIVDYTMEKKWGDFEHQEESVGPQAAYKLQVPSDQYWPGTDYWFNVSTATRLGNCNITTEDEKSEAPTLSIDNTTLSEISLSWEEPVEANGLVTGYSLTWADSYGGSYSEPLLDGALTEYTLTDNVLACTSYTVGLAAINGYGVGDIDDKTAVTEKQGPGKCSIASDSVSSVTVSWAPAPANCGRNGSLVAWEGQSLWEEGYSEEDQVQLPGTDGDFVLAVHPYTDYQVCVTLVDDAAAENDTSNCCSFVSLPLAPTPPKSFVCTSSSDSTLSLAWEEPDSWNGVALGYTLTFEDSELDIDDTAVILEELEANTDYSFTLVARSEGGPSDPADLAASTDGGGGETNDNVGLIVGLSVAAIVLVAAVVGAVMFFARRNQKMVSYTRGSGPHGSTELPGKTTYSQFDSVSSRCSSVYSMKSRA